MIRTRRNRSKALTAALIFSVPMVSAAYFFCDGQVASSPDQAKDGPPVVKITAPSTNSTSNWNSLVNYSVVVTYQGKSTQYQEIPSNQVLVRTIYLPDVSKAGELGTAAAPTPPGVLAIVQSNCMGCHGFKAKAMGPSFAAIAERFPDSQASMDTLSRYIHEGSTGIWGPRSMPPHPELTEEQLHAIVLWIVKQAADPNVNYYAGTDGAIRMEAPTTSGSTGGILLTASYTVSTPSSDQKQAAHGEDSLIVRGK